jgi:hypothetical protein
MRAIFEGLDAAGIEIGNRAEVKELYKAIAWKKDDAK